MRGTKMFLTGYYENLVIFSTNLATQSLEFDQKLHANLQQLRTSTTIATVYGMALTLEWTLL